MKYDLVIVGAGPAGLSAAIEAAECGMRILLIDENERPGGQLFKQIHKFFGSHRHQAGVRGFAIGTKLLERTQELGLEVWLNSEVLGMEQGHRLWVNRNKKELLHVNADFILLATGATENAVSFPGWDLPGVMGAGAAQTMINVQRVLPGKRVVMLGSGNVGVIVAYQLLQAGADVRLIVEAAPTLSGYGVHTAKVRRAGVPFLTSHTVKRVLGTTQVEGVEIVQVNGSFRPIPGTEQIVEADTLCLAAGLTPLTELAWIAGVDFTFIPPLGGHVPLHDEEMRTSIPHLYVAGDISGIEEASTAMEEGKLAGASVAHQAGFMEDEAFSLRCQQIHEDLRALRHGIFGEKRYLAKEELIRRAWEKRRECL